MQKRQYVQLVESLTRFLLRIIVVHFEDDGLQATVSAERISNVRRISDFLKELTNHKPAPRNSSYTSANSPRNDRSRCSASVMFVRHVSIAIALVTRRKDGPIEAPINDDVMNDSFVPRRHHGSILHQNKIKIEWSLVIATRARPNFRYYSPQQCEHRSELRAG